MDNREMFIPEVNAWGQLKRVTEDLKSLYVIGYISLFVKLFCLFVSKYIIKFDNKFEHHYPFRFLKGTLVSGMGASF